MQTHKHFKLTAFNCGVLVSKENLEIRHMCVCSPPLGGDVLTNVQYTAPLLQSGLHMAFEHLSKFQLDSRELCILFGCLLYHDYNEKLCGNSFNPVCNLHG